MVLCPFSTGNSEDIVCDHPLGSTTLVSVSYDVATILAQHVPDVHCVIGHLTVCFCDSLLCVWGPAVFVFALFLCLCSPYLLIGLLYSI